jgi:hypothetical protein
MQADLLNTNYHAKHVVNRLSTGHDGKTLVAMRNIVSRVGEIS